jgi:hypothetical protein
LGVGLTTLSCKKENCREASNKFSRILRRRPRPTLGCGAKERRKQKEKNILSSNKREGNENQMTVCLHCSYKDVSWKAFQSHSPHVSTNILHNEKWFK